MGGNIVTDPCGHAFFDFKAAHSPAVPGGIRMLELAATCTACGARALFRGVPLGASQANPTMSVDHATLRIPFTMEGEVLLQDLNHGKIIGIGERKA